MQHDESMPIPTAEHTHLVFWEELRDNGLATKASGHIMSDTVLMMRVTVAGDNKNNVEYWVEVVYPDGYPHPMFGKRRVNDNLTAKYGRYIDEYKARQGGPVAVSGTPIEHWPLISRAQVHNLKHNGVYSVEALAGLTDTQIGAIGMDGRKFTQLAKDWLATAANSAAAMQAQERERKTEERFKALEEKYDDLAASLAELPEGAQAQVQASLVKRRGRPPKAQAA